MVNVVTREARSIARETQDALEARDVQGVAFLAVASASGVVIAQEIADRVLPALGFNREPTSATGFAVSAGVKGLVALLVGALTGGLTGIPLAFAAFAAVGHVASAGADLLNAVQRTGFFAENPRQTAANALNSGSAGASRTTSKSASRDSSPTSGATGGGATVSV